LDEEKTKHAQFPDPRNENWMKKSENILSFLTQQMKFG
jgi:hypothetical protein